ncbi:MAG: RidA family protein [Pseudomonadota bacterium]
MPITKHNPKDVFPQYQNYSHGIELSAGSRILFISGLNGYEGDRATMPETFSGQADLIWGHIGTILKSAGMDYRNIVSLRTYLSDPVYREENNRTNAKYLGDSEPSSTVVCCRLLESRWKLEIEAIAAD